MVDYNTGNPDRTLWCKHAGGLQKKNTDWKVEAYWLKMKGWGTSRLSSTSAIGCRVKHVILIAFALIEKVECTVWGAFCPSFSRSGPSVTNHLTKFQLWTFQSLRVRNAQCKSVIFVLCLSLIPKTGSKIFIVLQMHLSLPHDRSHKAWWW